MSNLNSKCTNNNIVLVHYIFYLLLNYLHGIFVNLITKNVKTLFVKIYNPIRPIHNINFEKVFIQNKIRTQRHSHTSLLLLTFLEHRCQNVRKSNREIPYETA